MTFFETLQGAGLNEMWDDSMAQVDKHLNAKHGWELQSQLLMIGIVSDRPHSLHMGWWTFGQFWCDFEQVV